MNPVFRIREICVPAIDSPTIGKHPFEKRRWSAPGNAWAEDVSLQQRPGGSQVLVQRHICALIDVTQHQPVRGHAVIQEEFQDCFRVHAFLSMDFNCRTAELAGDCRPLEQLPR